MTLVRKSTSDVNRKRNLIGIGFLFDGTPEPGQAVEVAEGVWWFALPINTPLKSVNCYLLDDGDGWTLIDTGSNHLQSRVQLETVLASEPFASKPLRRVIATHYHPDHIGLAGHLVSGDIEFACSENCWSRSHRAWEYQPEVPVPEHVEFMQRAGIPPAELEVFRRTRPMTFSKSVTPLPKSFTKISEGDLLQIAGREWRVHMGYGHAEEHITLWASGQDIAIVGDQILPAVSSNLPVSFRSPEANPVKQWIASCQRFAEIANDEAICLPGHNRPFVGAPHRCRLLIKNCESVALRLNEQLARPSTAVDCLQSVYVRKLGAYERIGLIGQTVGYLNHLLELGLVDRESTSSGQFRWQRKRIFDGNEIW